jgi:hypothetical protein
MAQTELQNLWNNARVDLVNPTRQDVIIGLLARNLQLACEIVQNPGLWIMPISAILVRCMIETQIRLAWLIKRGSDTDFKDYVEYGLGQEKLYIEHLKRLSVEDRLDKQQIIGDIEEREKWINAQRFTFLLPVDVGGGNKGKDLRVMADELLPHATDFGLRVTDETERTLRTTAFALSFDETRFFRYLLDFGNRLSVLRRHLRLADEPELFAEEMRRAQREERVGMSLQRIQFFRYFGGKGLKAISVMWLICLTSGLLMLVALDRIPEDSVPYLVSIPIAIGVMALGTTLSLGLRAMRSRE